MKVFISHSWKDKSLATEIFEALQPDGHQVWYDIHQLIPGDNIQDVIDVYIGKCDVVVLLWSLQAFGSDGVDAEIKTARKFHKRIIPLLADKTPLDHHEDLKGVLGIPLDPLDTGTLLLRRALLLLSASDADKEASWFKEIFGNITELGGYLNYINTYRLKQEDLKEDGHKEAWAGRIEKLADDNEKIRTELMPKMQDTMAQLQDIMAKLEKGGVGKEQLETWKQWCQGNKDFHPELMGNLAGFIEKDLERLQQGGAPVHVVAYDGLEKTINRLENAINHTKGAASEKMTAKIKKYGGFLLGEKTIRSMVTGYMNYVTMCPTLLRELVQESKKSEYVAVKEALYEVEKFLNQKDRTHIAPNATLEQFFDDAYIINNTIQLLLDTELIKKENFSYDTTAVNLVNTYVVFAISSAEKNRLDGVLQQIKQMIGYKKKEINWGQVAAIGVGALAVLGGIAALTGEGGGDITDNSSNADSLGGGSFEDKMANFNARQGGGLSDNFYK